jgi:hypothetical protein
MKRRAKQVFALVGVLAVALLTPASGGAGSALPKAPDLSSPAAIVKYLQSIGVDPATVTWQQGLLNYAGPSCPGVGWNCTTSTRVVQITTAGGENRTECKGKPADSTTVTPGDQTCLVVQEAPLKGANHAKCDEKSDEAFVVQVCTIMQDNPGGSNHADVHQENHAKEEALQDATQTADVMQTGDDNHSEIHQDVHQSLTGGDPQQQDAHQFAFVDQTAPGSSNFSHVHQTQDQNESGAAGTQLQNTEPAPSECGSRKPDPNQCAIVTQRGNAPESAKNDSHLHQKIGERQSTTAFTGSQQQGLATGGQGGEIHQENPVGLGKNHDHAHQDLRQRQSAPPGSLVTQSQQTDPSCCGFSQVGGDENREDIHQSTTQSASGDFFDQFSDLFGHVEQTSGDEESASLTVQPTQPETSDNKCRIDQHGRNNDGSGHFSVSGEGAVCEFLTLETICTSGGCGPPSEESVDGIELPTVLTFPSMATFGQPIDMPDYTAEPEDFVDSP